MNFLHIFIQQTRKDLIKIQKLTENLKQDKNTNETLENLKRTIHIIHGTSNLYGLEVLEAKSFFIEEKILSTLSKTIEPGDLYPYLLQYTKDLGSILENIENSGEEGLNHPGEYKKNPTESKSQSDLNPILEELQKIRENLSQTETLETGTSKEDLQKLTQKIIGIQKKKEGIIREEAIQLVTKNGNYYELPVKYILKIYPIFTYQSLNPDKDTKEILTIPVESLLNPEKDQSILQEPKYEVEVFFQKKILRISTFKIGNYTLLPVDKTKEICERIEELIQKNGKTVTDSPQIAKVKSKILLFQNSKQLFSFPIDKIQFIECNLKSKKDENHNLKIPEYLQPDENENPIFNLVVKIQEKKEKIPVVKIENILSKNLEKVKEESNSRGFSFVYSTGKGIYRDREVFLLNI